MVFRMDWAGVTLSYTADTACKKTHLILSFSDTKRTNLVLGNGGIFFGTCMANGPDSAAYRRISERTRG